MADDILYNKDYLFKCFFAFRENCVSFFFGFCAGLILSVCIFVLIKDNYDIYNIIKNPTFTAEYFVNDYHKTFLKESNDDNERLFGKTDIVLHYGDNLFYSIVKNHFDRNDANDVVSLLGSGIDMKKLTAGQSFHIDYSYRVSAKLYERYRGKYNHHNLYYPEYRLQAEERRIEKFTFKLTDGTKYFVSRTN